MPCHVTPNHTEPHLTTPATPCHTGPCLTEPNLPHRAPPCRTTPYLGSLIHVPLDHLGEFDQVTVALFDQLPVPFHLGQD